MSPHYFSDSGAVVFYVYGSSNAGRLNANSVNFPSGVVRPVISLKSCVEFEPDGDGSSSNPYTIKTFEDSSTCALAVN